MKKLIFTLALALPCFALQAQESEKRAQVRVHYSALAPVEWGTDHGYMGGGLGISGAMGKHWTINADFTWYGRDITSGDGYIDRNIVDTRASVDFYFSRAYKGFFIGGVLGYTQINEDLVGTSTSLPAPDQLVPLGFQLGFNTSLNKNFDLNIRTAFASAPGDAGMITINAGIGYRF